MLHALLYATLALAAPDCPDPERAVHEAWGEYQDAEMSAAGTRLDGVIGALGCQREVVPPSVLLELFWLRALVGWSAGDEAATVSALTRAVAVDSRPVARPPLKYGPELRQQWSDIAAAAQGNTVSVEPRGTGALWIDGHRIEQLTPIARGTHLVQVRPAGGVLQSTVETVAQPRVVDTGGPTVAPAPPDPPEPPPWAVRRRVHPPVLAAAAAVAAVGSAFALASGARSEASFRQSAYRAASYEGCAIGQACYPLARADAVRTDAARINRVYGVGYGLAALSGSLLTITVIGVPARGGGASGAD